MRSSARKRPGIDRNVLFPENLPQNVPVEGKFPFQIPIMFRFVGFRDVLLPARPSERLF